MPESTSVIRFKNRIEAELFDSVLPFWENHSPDTKNGGYYNCLDRDGSLYDTRKHIWLQGRQAWMFSTLYRNVEQSAGWLELAGSGVKFLQQFAVKENGRVYFEMTDDGKPIYLQRKIFSECFYIMALAGYGHASGQSSYLKEAEEQLERVWKWSKDLSQVGRPSFEGEVPAQSLAIPMILLNLIEEVTLGETDRFRREINECIERILLHVHTDRKMVFETVTPDGEYINSIDGRLLNPGHAIEAGWFLQRWAQRLEDPELAKIAAQMVRWSFETGWDKQHGGLYYFLDSEGYSPTQLEWDMKLWWPHCEAMIGHLMNASIFENEKDWQLFEETAEYTFNHFPDEKHGEWFGYLNRSGEVTHRFKGGSYKGCFHVPRALYICWELLKNMENKSA